MDFAGRAGRWFAWRLEWAVSSRRLSAEQRRWLLVRLGLQLSPEACVREGTTFVCYRTTVADGCFVSRDCYFEDHASVALERNVWVGAQAQFLTATHEIGDETCRAGAWRCEPITVGAGSWVGAGAIILPGVTIGPGCVIAAGAVVRGDCQANGLYAGVPAVRKADLPVSSPGTGAAGSDPARRDGQPTWPAGASTGTAVAAG